MISRHKIKRLIVSLNEEEAIKGANRLKYLDKLLFVIIPYDIKICCQMFFWCSWLPSIRKNIPEYGSSMTAISKNTGIVLCPKCLVMRLKNK